MRLLKKIWENGPIDFHWFHIQIFLSLTFFFYTNADAVTIKIKFVKPMEVKLRSKISHRYDRKYVKTNCYINFIENRGDK